MGKVLRVFLGIGLGIVMLFVSVGLLTYIADNLIKVHYGVIITEAQIVVFLITISVLRILFLSKADIEANSLTSDYDADEWGNLLESFVINVLKVCFSLFIIVIYTYLFL